MKTLLLLSLTAGAMLFSGCSSKQYFEPENTLSASAAESSFNGTIVDVSRDGATLANGGYIDRSGIHNISLGEGFRFLSESGKYILASNAEGMFRLIDKNSGKVIKEVKMQPPVVSASIRNGLVAYILENNAFGLYSIKEGKKIVENRSERTYAIDARAASPLFIDTLVVMPMLDGKLVIFDTRDPEAMKVVYLSSDKVFNNVIYLERMGDTLVAATPKKLLTLGTEGEFEYKKNVADVAIGGKYVYLFTKEGDIIKLDIALEPLAAKKFTFAHFVAATVYKNKVYALDKQGSLIVLNPDLNKYKIYDVGEVDSPVFIAGGKLYKDGEIIHLDRLGY